MTIKFEIDVPKGATKIDIGPVIEPIVARLVRLERLAGYKDALGINFDRKMKTEHEPVTEEDMDRWLRYCGKQRETYERIAELTYPVITNFLKKEGWEKDDSERDADWQYNDDYKTTGKPYRERRCERWKASYKKTPGWGGCSRPFETYTDARVPLDNCYPDRKRVYMLTELIGAICEARRESWSGSYDRRHLHAVLEDIEKTVHPLVQLAGQADPSCLDQ